jgi:hypothetical protein
MIALSLVLTVSLWNTGTGTGAGPLVKPTTPARHTHVFHGVVVHVHHDKETGHRHFVVKEHKHLSKKDGDKVEETIEKKFHVNAETTFEVVSEGKTLEKTTFAHLHKGKHVIVHYKNHTDINKSGKHEHLATEVKIHHKELPL